MSSSDKSRKHKKAASKPPNESNKGPQRNLPVPEATGDDQEPVIPSIIVTTDRTQGHSGDEEQLGSASDAGRPSMTTHSTAQPKQKSKDKSSSKGKAKQAQSDDWSDVMEPDERRRIQNRIAQRKFREKAREQKEKAERDSRNTKHAGSSYRVPDPADLEAAGQEELSGLPWGGVSMRHVMARGHESESRRGSRRESDNAWVNAATTDGGGSGSGPIYDDSYLMMPFDSPVYGEDNLYDESPYYYDYDPNMGGGDPSGGGSGGAPPASGA